MSIILDPSKNFVAIQIMYIEEKDSKHDNVKYSFINSHAEFESWKAKGYSTKEEIEISKTTTASSPSENQPGMPVGSSGQNSEKIIQVLKTWWSRMNWKEQNIILGQCFKQTTGSDGESKTDLDMIVYRDMKLKTCLKKWDLKDDNNQEITITPSVIDSLVPEVAQQLLNNFEQVTEATDKQLKK